MKILKNEKVFKTSSILILMLALVLGCLQTNNANAIVTTDSETNNTNIEPYSIGVMYSSHIQDHGWEKDFSKINGQSSGTTGQNKKNEAIKIKLINAPEGVEIQYQAHVQDVGWQSWKSNGEIAGTTGQNKRVEAIKIKLNNTESYFVEYRTHVQDIGWQNWVKDGQVAGTTGRCLKIEAIEIRIIPKTPTVIYQSHVQDIGWQQYFNNGQTSGTTGKNLKVEAMRIDAKNLGQNIKVRYKSLIQDYGWELNWRTDGELTGTSGKNKRMEAIKIELDDNDDYSIMYRVHIQDIGWQVWKKDGEIAGTTDKKLKIEAIEIKIIPKEPNTNFEVKYSTHVQDIGWTNYVRQERTSGVIGRNLKIEAIKIDAINVPENVKILYKSHVQDYGWESTWKNLGEKSGTTGQNKKIEAVQIKLEGTEEYSIEYRTYVQGRGWQDWANDGETSGTTGKNLKIEAIEIKIVPKIAYKAKMYIDTNISKNLGQEEYKIRGWLMTNANNAKIQILDDDNLVEVKIDRTQRKDVLEAIKGYGGEINNPNPGFEITIDFSKIKIGNRILKIQVIDEKGKVLCQESRNIKVCEKMKYTEGIYGKSGLKIANKGGSDLKYLKYGNGDNVFFATFAIHGFEDLWNNDGNELVNIANKFYNRLLNDKDYDLSEKWTIYIFPGVNQDGLNNGWTNYGPGRTTLYSEAPKNKGIDLNRCWQVGNSYTRYTDDRNYNGITGFQAYEAQALRDFLLNNKSQNGQTLLVDLHGWTQQLIGDAEICSYYNHQFPENDKSAIGRYGTGYLINWARTYLGSNGKAAKSALIELPYQGVNGSQSVIDKKFANRYIEATLEMLRNM